MEIDWSLTGCLSIFGALLLAVIGNIITRPVQNVFDKWWSQTTLANRQKKITEIDLELQKINLIANDKRELMRQILPRTFYSIVLLLIGLSFLVASIFFSFNCLLYVLFDNREDLTAFYFYIASQVSNGISLLCFLGIFWLMRFVFSVLRKVYNISDYTQQLEIRRKELKNT